MVQNLWKLKCWCYVRYVCFFLSSSALKKYAPFKNVFQKRKIPKLFKETWFDEEYKNLRERQLVYAKYSKISSPEKWSAYSKLRTKLSSVVKEKQEQFSWNYFISLELSKNRRNFINNVRGQNQPVTYAVLKKFLGDLIVDDENIAENIHSMSKFW